MISTVLQITYGNLLGAHKGFAIERGDRIFSILS